MKSIRHETIGSYFDGNCVLANDFLSREIGVQGDWQRIRIGVRFVFSDPLASVEGGPEFWFGLIQSGSANNSVLSSSTSQFLGLSCYSSQMTRTLSGDNPILTSSMRYTRRAGSTTTRSFTITPTGYFTTDPSFATGALFLEFYKAASDKFSMRGGYASSGTFANDITSSVFAQMLGESDFATAMSLSGYSAPISESDILTSEIVSAMNFIHVAWSRSLPVARLFGLGWVKFE